METSNETHDAQGAGERRCGFVTVLGPTNAGKSTLVNALVGTKVAEVVTGGRLTRATRVSEQYLLDLEREAFVSLCGTRATQERLAHMLKTGKPLRN